jgi:hypothetical protein
VAVFLATFFFGCEEEFGYSIIPTDKPIMTTENEEFWSSDVVQGDLVE